MASSSRRPLKPETSPDQVVRWMVGREIATLNYVQHAIGEHALLEVERLSLPSAPGSGRPSLRDISFNVHAGEVVGIAGLLGAGRTELLEAIFGASPFPQPPRARIRLLDRTSSSFFQTSGRGDLGRHRHCHCR